MGAGSDSTAVAQSTPRDPHSPALAAPWALFVTGVAKCSMIEQACYFSVPADDAGGEESRARAEGKFRVAGTFKAVAARRRLWSAGKIASPPHIFTGILSVE